MRRPGRVIVTALLAGALGLGAAVAGATPAQAADTPSSVSGLTLSATSVNTTDADRFVTVRFRVRDAEGVEFVNLKAENADVASLPAQFGWGAQSATAGIGPSLAERVGGTAQDGTYEIRLQVFRSYRGPMVLNLLIRDQQQNDVAVSGADLRAAGMPDRFTATSTLPVPKLSNLKGRSLTSIGSTMGIPYLSREGQITYTVTGFATALNVVSQSGCSDGYLYDIYLPTGPIVWSQRGVFPCTVKVRALNGSGYGPTVSLTFI